MMAMASHAEHGAAAPAGGTAPRLGTTRISLRTSKSSRAERWNLRDVAREITELERLQKCGKTPVGSAVSIRSGADGAAGYAGLATCGSVWSCPVCSAKIAAHRKTELHAVLDWALAEGLHVSMLTLTQRHHSGQSLELLWDALSYAWGRVTSGAGWRDFKEQMGLCGFVKAVEVTHGMHGWHVHQHVLVLSEKNPQTAPLYRYRKVRGKNERRVTSIETPAGFIGNRWKRALAAKGIDFIADSGGLDWRVARPGDARELGDYIAKLGGATGAALRAAKTAEGVAKEATLGQFKKAKRGNRTPFQILGDIGLLGLSEDVALWQEYERVSRGRRAMSWSQGLRQMAQLGDELTDEEIAAQEEGDRDLAVFDNSVWREYVYPVAVTLLEIVETGGDAALYAYLDREGIPYELARDTG